LAKENKYHNELLRQSKEKLEILETSGTSFSILASLLTKRQQYFFCWLVGV